jgi:nucleoporin POM152
VYHAKPLQSSGDTGVSASLVLRGTGPFQVYYQSQKDKEPPRELIKTIGGSRGEITLQPDQSGHYKFTFTHLSDANYMKIPLNGPSIEQVVHPLASADFATRDNTALGRTRKLISSCGGTHVDIPVDLKVGFRGLFCSSKDLPCS